jgi:hypothetical protein
MDVRCGVRTARLPGVQGTVLYEGSDVRTVNGFVFPRDRGLEYASPKYRRRNSVIIIASLREYKRAPAMPLPILTCVACQRACCTYTRVFPPPQNQPLSLIEKATDYIMA